MQKQYFKVKNKFMCMRVFKKKVVLPKFEVIVNELLFSIWLVCLNCGTLAAPHLLVSKKSEYKLT